MYYSPKNKNHYYLISSRFNTSTQNNAGLKMNRLSFIKLIILLLYFIRVLQYYGLNKGLMLWLDLSIIEMNECVKTLMQLNCLFMVPCYNDFIIVKPQGQNRIYNHNSNILLVNWYKLCYEKRENGHTPHFVKILSTMYVTIFKVNIILCIFLMCFCMLSLVLYHVKFSNCLTQIVQRAVSFFILILELTSTITHRYIISTKISVSIFISIHTKLKQRKRQFQNVNYFNFVLLFKNPGFENMQYFRVNDCSKLFQIFNTCR